MKEVKAPKKPIISYYVIILAVMLIFNFFVMPGIAKSRIKNARYDEFMDMTLNKEIGKVEVQQNQILFTDTEEKNIYKTGTINDPDMVNRLYDSGAKFSSDIVEEVSPFVSLIFSWVIPILIFVLIGRFMSKKMMDKVGGDNAMMFGMGKSNAKIYVQSTEGIKFSDVAGGRS